LLIFAFIPKEKDLIQDKTKTEAVSGPASFSKRLKERRGSRVKEYAASRREERVKTQVKEAR